MLHDKVRKLFYSRHIYTDETTLPLQNHDPIRPGARPS
jgi:hypothetical protein